MPAKNEIIDFRLTFAVLCRYIVVAVGVKNRKREIFKEIIVTHSQSLTHIGVPDTPNDIKEDGQDTIRNLLSKLHEHI